MHNCTIVNLLGQILTNTFGDLNSNTWGPLLGPCGYHQFLDGFWYWAYHISWVNCGW